MPATAKKFRHEEVLCQQIQLNDPLYQQERELRNRILLRPIGIADFGWEMNDHCSAHFVAIKNQQAVGCVLLIQEQADSKQARLSQMAVDTPLQGEGIGQKLVHLLLNYATEQGLERVTCHARDNAVNFYKKLGFEVIGDPFVEVGITHYLMQVEINQALNPQHTE
ncbi:GNAT family N-acetyltransferase [Dongshaea marina]|uniref:GNAT family N-acetyltransferase n=1 Tax=Dongshaea marina TaxID=2047966 RepID=UPI000D3E3201|nr:GNAT family N-acetyltransferase [Dongshaea marina]